MKEYGLHYEQIVATHLETQKDKSTHADSKKST